ncbi:MAG: Tad domain-containing protein [Pseudomonadota bacterium]
MRRERGQLTLGMAAGFAMALAILGLVLRSGMITREKMKLQQTSDLAALVAADTQRNWLNRLREINQEIDKLYREFNTAILANPTPCLTIAAAIAGGWDCIRLPKVADMLSSVDIPGAASNALPPMCQTSCPHFDNFYRATLVTAYGIKQAMLMGLAVKVIEQANQVANDDALATFLAPPNLPFGLQKILDRKYNGNVTTAAVRQDYDSGRLSDTYAVIDANKDLPLFQAKLEGRSFKWPTALYASFFTPPPATTCFCAPVGTGYPGLAMVAGKITKTGDYQTSFFTGVQYTPRKEDIEKFGLFYKQADSKRPYFGEESQDSSGAKLPLFTQRRSMAALSLAKPYGGKFPRAAANPFSFTDAGDPGTDFEGAKLIGLADKAQMGGYRLPLDNEICMYDPQTQAQRCSKVYTEDYLH